MSIPTLKQRILELVSLSEGLTDREITDRLLGYGAGQQAVNQAARALDAAGKLQRRPRHDGKIGNYPASVGSHHHTSASAIAQGAAPISRPSAIVSADDLASIRRALLRILDSLDEDKVANEGPARRISRLSRCGRIPREIAALMLAISEMRNAAEYEAKTLTDAESLAVRSSWQVVKGWSERLGT